MGDAAISNTYLDLYLSGKYANNTPAALLTMLLLTLARILPIIAQAPFFGARVLPNPVKVTFAISLWIIFLPQLLITTETPLTFDFRTLLLFGKELFIGFCIGFLASIPFSIVQNVGMIIDHQRGGASLMVNDPTIQNQSSPLGTLFNMMLIYIFFMMDGPFHIIEAIRKSYEVIPLDRFLNPQFFNSASPFWKLQMDVFNTMMVLTIQLAAPGLLIILMTDVFLGIANRLAPQVQITFLGMPLKSLLALMVIYIGLKAFVDQLVLEAYKWLQVISKAIDWLNITPS
jgi:type III secretion protein SpaR/YscT/HrcT